MRINYDYLSTQSVTFLTSNAFPAVVNVLGTGDPTSVDLSGPGMVNIGMGNVQGILGPLNLMDSQPAGATINVDDSADTAQAALRDLPRSVREYVENVPLLVEDFPSEELLLRENVSPQILGVFLGVPRTEASVTAPVHDMDRVILFKKNLEKVCRDRSELLEQIQVTVKHEIGHYLGLDDESLERLGLA